MGLPSMRRPLWAVKNGGGESAHRRRGAEHAEADRARVEDVARVHGQERGRTPQEHRQHLRELATWVLFSISSTEARL